MTELESLPENELTVIEDRSGFFKSPAVFISQWKAPSIVAVCLPGWKVLNEDYSDDGRPRILYIKSRVIKELNGDFSVGEYVIREFDSNRDSELINSVIEYEKAKEKFPELLDRQASEKYVWDEYESQ